MVLNKEEKYTIEEVQKLFKESYEKIESIEKKALRVLAVRRLSKDAPEEEINAKMEEIWLELKSSFTEHQEEAQKVMDAFSAGDFKGLDQAQFLEKLSSYFGKGGQ